jgi:hypothetical protein
MPDRRRWPACGRPHDVLRFIDYCLDPERPFVMNMNGGVGEMRRALREANCGLRAADARYWNAVDHYHALRKIHEGTMELERVAR